MYPPHLVAPMSKELNDIGVESLTTPEQVSEVLDKNEGTVLLVVNSVCGCAAANARPGAAMAIQNEKKPDTLTTVFCGCRPGSHSESKGIYATLSSFISFYCFI